MGYIWLLLYLTIIVLCIPYSHCLFLFNNNVDISNKVEKAEKTHNLIEGCDLQKYGIINTGTNSQMSPDESKLLLMDLLKLYDPQFTPDQIPRLSGLVCGFVTGTAQHLWASEEEFAALGDKVTIRSV